MTSKKLMIFLEKIAEIACFFFNPFNRTINPYKSCNPIVTRELFNKGLNKINA